MGRGGRPSLSDRGINQRALLHCIRYGIFVQGVYVNVVLTRTHPPNLPYQC